MFQFSVLGGMANLQPCHVTSFNIKFLVEDRDEVVTALVMSFNSKTMEGKINTFLFNIKTLSGALVKERLK